jgi:acetyltransferase
VGKTLLFLDTQAGSDAERLYRKLGWEAAAGIPDFAYTPTGELAPTTVMYKRLAQSGVVQTPADVYLSSGP